MAETNKAEEYIIRLAQAAKGEAIDTISRQAKRSVDDIVQQIDAYVASLSIEVPTSIMELVGRGGQARQVICKGPTQSYMQNPQWANTVNVSVGPAWDNAAARTERFEGEFPKGARVTIIVEPIE